MGKCDRLLLSRLNSFGGDRGRLNCLPAYTIAKLPIKKSMQKTLSIVGIIAILFGLLFGSYKFGYQKGIDKGYEWWFQEEREPTAEEVEFEKFKNDVIDDVVNVSVKYQSLYDICEQKYQSALKGDLNTAFEFKGQITVLEQQIEEIKNKYSKYFETEKNDNKLL